MLRSAVLHFYDTLSLRAPSLCTAVALTWIRALRGVEIKQGAQPGCCQKPHKGSQNHASNTGVCMLPCVKSRRYGICVCMSRGVLYACMPAKVHLGVCTFACVVCLPRGRGLWPLIIHQQRPYTSIPEPLSPRILIHYWEVLPEENRPERKLDTPASWAALLINSSSTIFFSS